MFSQGDFRAGVPRNSPENMAANMAVVRPLEEWVVRTGSTPGQISQVWLLARRPWVVPLPSANRTARVPQRRRVRAR